MSCLRWAYKNWKSEKCPSPQAIISCPFFFRISGSNPVTSSKSSGQKEVQHLVLKYSAERQLVHVPAALTTLIYLYMPLLTSLSGSFFKCVLNSLSVIKCTSLPFHTRSRWVWISMPRCISIKVYFEHCKLNTCLNWN